MTRTLAQHDALARKRGKEARQRDSLPGHKPEDDAECPYPLGTRGAREWMKGYSNVPDEDALS